MKLLKRKLLVLIEVIGFMFIAVIATGCAKNNTDVKKQDGKLNIVATTTMLADVVNIISGEQGNVTGLMGPGNDPHLYQASAGDIKLMENADVILYGGLHLEGKMGEIFSALEGNGKEIICAADGLEQEKIIETDGIQDPHIWFDVTLWKEVVEYVQSELSRIDPDHAVEYEKNAVEYLKELDDLNTYINNRINEIPDSQRVLVTAHDAFHYFGTAYGIEVVGLQGISTEAEAGTSDVSELAEFIADNQIKAVFVETSISSKSIEALQAAVSAKGFEVSIGGTLYSDSLGDADSGTETYIKTVKSNVDTIVEALK